MGAALRRREPFPGYTDRRRRRGLPATKIVSRAPPISRSDRVIEFHQRTFRATSDSDHWGRPGNVPP